MFTLPAGASLSLPAATAALPTAAAVPTKARFWAIYMSSLHGECTPQALQNLLNIPGADAKRYVGQLVADGVLKPNPLLNKSVSQVFKSKDDTLIDKVKKRSKMKAQAKQQAAQKTASDELLAEEPLETAQLTDDETDVSENPNMVEAHLETDKDTLIEGSKPELDQDQSEIQPDTPKSNLRD